MGRWWSAPSTCSCVSLWASTKRCTPALFSHLLQSKVSRRLLSVAQAVSTNLTVLALRTAQNLATVTHIQMPVHFVRAHWRVKGSVDSSISSNHFHSNFNALLQDIDAAVQTYLHLSERWFTHASPTLFNAGTPRPQLSSCFLIAMKVRSGTGLHLTSSISGWSWS